jgi:hypothetical protein
MDFNRRTLAMVGKNIGGIPDYLMLKMYYGLVKELIRGLRRDGLIRLPGLGSFSTWVGISRGNAIARRVGNYAIEKRVKFKIHDTLRMYILTNEDSAIQYFGNELKRKLMEKGWKKTGRNGVAWKHKDGILEIKRRMTIGKIYELLKQTGVEVGIPLTIEERQEWRKRLWAANKEKRKASGLETKG